MRRAGLRRGGRGEVAIVLADAYLEKFGHDNMTDIKAAVKSYRQRLRTLSR